jgi:hypothetical protein
VILILALPSVDRQLPEITDMLSGPLPLPLLLAPLLAPLLEVDVPLLALLALLLTIDFGGADAGRDGDEKCCWRWYWWRCCWRCQCLSN